MTTDPEKFDRYAFAEKVFLTLLGSSPDAEMNAESAKQFAEYSILCANTLFDAMVEDADEEPETRAESDE